MVLVVTCRHRLYGISGNKWTHTGIGCGIEA